MPAWSWAHSSVKDRRTRPSVILVSALLSRVPLTDGPAVPYVKRCMDAIMPLPVAAPPCSAPAQPVAPCPVCPRLDADFEPWRQAAFYRTLHQRAVQREQQLQQENDALRARIRSLEQRLFGRKRDSPPTLPEDTVVATAAPAGPRRRRGQQPDRPRPRRRAYDHLPAVEEVHALPAEQQQCPQCGQPLAPFPGTEDSTVLEVAVRAHRRVLRGAATGRRRSSATRATAGCTVSRLREQGYYQSRNRAVLPLRVDQKTGSRPDPPRSDPGPTGRGNRPDGSAVVSGQPGWARLLRQAGCEPRGQDQTAGVKGEGDPGVAAVGRAGRERDSPPHAEMTQQPTLRPYPASQGDAQ